MLKENFSKRQSINFTARKRFGQNFLMDQNVIDKIVDLIDPQPPQHIVEIGPGRGALTEKLLAKNTLLTAIELDRDLYAWLTAHFDQAQFDLINGDALRFDFRQLAYNGQLLRIVGNLPYNISTPLIFYLLTMAEVIVDMHFMLQQEVVKRLIATPNSPARGRLSVMVQYFCQVNAFFLVSPSAFVPEPKVTSQLVRLIPYKNMPHLSAYSLEHLTQVVRQGFSQPRKTLRNNLKKLFTQAQLASLPIDLTRRPETLTVEEWVGLTNSYTQQQGTL